MINSKDIHVRNRLTDSDHIRQEKEQRARDIGSHGEFQRKKFGRNLSLCSVSEDAGFELRTVTTVALAVSRRSNRSAIESHPQRANIQ
jgi:hypothetical protein